jgi:hypothetical protein
MACINCGKIDKNIIFPIVSIIFIIIENIIFNKTIILNNFYRHIFIICIGQSLGKFLSFIPFIILNKKNKNLNKDNEIINDKLVYKKEYYEKYRKIKYKKFGLIILFSFLNFILNIIYYRIMIFIEFDFWIFDVVFIIIFSYFILNIKLYSHQYLSTIIIFILGFALNIINLLAIEVNYINILISILTEIIFSLNIVVNKYLMEYTFCSPYEICFYDGIISLILFIITFAIVTNIEIEEDQYAIEYNGKYYIDNFFQFCEDFNIKEFFIFICEIIYYFIYYLFPLITIKNYNATHYLIILIFDFEVTFLLDIQIKWRFYLTIIIFFIILFMILVFNEIIELNCYGFQKNTKKNITIRAELETLNRTENKEDNNCELADANYFTEFEDGQRFENI